MALAEEEIGEVLVLQPAERLDVASGPELSHAVKRVLAEGQRRILIDFAGVGYVSSHGLAACLKSAKLAQAAGGRIALCSLAGMVDEVFDMAGFKKLFDIHGSREDALAAFGA